MRSERAMLSSEDDAEEAMGNALQVTSAPHE